jgi:hypothetical protein
MAKDHRVAPDQDLCHGQRHCTRYFTAIAKSERRAGMLGRYGAAMEHTVSLQTAR